MDKQSASLKLVLVMLACLLLLSSVVVALGGGFGGDSVPLEGIMGGIDILDDDEEEDDCPDCFTCNTATPEEKCELYWLACDASPNIFGSGTMCHNLIQGNDDINYCFPDVSNVDDGDGDGSGSRDDSVCGAPEFNSDCCAVFDCDDTNPAVNSYSEEICDGFDTDCDGKYYGEPGEGEDTNYYGMTTSFGHFEQDGDGDGVIDCFDKCLDENMDFSVHDVAMDIYGCSLALDQEDGWQRATLSGISSGDIEEALEDISGASIVDITGMASWSSSSSGYVVNDPTAPEGIRTLYLDVVEGDGVYQEVELEPDTLYSISFYGKRASGPGRGLMVFDTGSDVHAIDWGHYSWRRHYINFTTPNWSGNETIEFWWVAYEDDASFYIDSVQLEKAPEPTNYYQFNYEYGCCPDDFCWTGGDCIHDDWYENYALFPPIGADYGDDGFRCIAGDWQYSTAKPDPRYRNKGYCNDEMQCFGRPGAGGTDAIELALEGLNTLLAQLDLQNIDYTLLVHIRYLIEGIDAESWCQDNNTYGFFEEYGESFYCYNGAWTTRTKAIAMQLLDFTTVDDDYTLFCDTYDNALGFVETQGLEFDVLRGFGFQNTETNALQQFFMETGDERPIFNEFCVLRLNDKVLVGSSLNHINFTQKISVSGGLGDTKYYSVLQLLRGPTVQIGADDYCDNVVTDLDKYDGEFYPCNDGSDSDVWYNPGLESFVMTLPKYPTEDIHLVDMPTQRNFFEVIFQAVQDVLDTLLSVFGIARASLIDMKHLKFIENAGDFDKLYISNFNDGETTIMALKETRYNEGEGTVHGKFKSILTAQYNNYYADVCDILIENDVIRYLLLEDQASFAEERCTINILSDDDWQYDVYYEGEDVENAIESELYLTGYDAQQYFKDDFFWNDLTAKIRTRDMGLPDEMDKDDPVIYESEYALIIGQPAIFNLTADLNISNVKAVAWEFGDGKKHVRKVVTEVDPVYGEHIYEEPGIYDVKVYVLYDDYRILTDTLEGVEVYEAIDPQIFYDPVDDAVTPGVETTVSLRVEFNDGRGDLGEDYGFYWTFDDEDPGEERLFTESAIMESEATHTYSYDSFLATNGTFTIEIDIYLPEVPWPVRATRVIAPTVP